MMTLFAALSAMAKTYLLRSFSIFLLKDFTERLVGCLYKCGCLVKFTIRMSIIRKNSFFQSLRACAPKFSFLHHRLQYNWSASSTILRHLVKSIPDGSLYFKIKIMFLIGFFVLITNKRRVLTRLVKILEILRDFRSDSVISKNVRNVQQV